MDFHPSIICAEFGQQYTIRDVAKLMKCSNDHVVALYDDGELEGINIARSGAKHRELRFSEEALDAFADRRKGQVTSTVIEPKGKPTGQRKAPPSDENYGSWFDE
jgi:excisionase family DNA binding protein